MNKYICLQKSVLKQVPNLRKNLNSSKYCKSTEQVRVPVRACKQTSESHGYILNGHWGMVGVPTDSSTIHWFTYIDIGRSV